MRSKPIDELIFKGTHNSYDARRRVPPPEQIDNFGVWAIELDYSIPNEDPRPRRAVVGHDGPGAAADGEAVIGGDPAPGTPAEQFCLEFFLQAIRELQRSGALRYRPIFIYFEKKQWTTVIPGFPFPTIGRLDDSNFDEPSQFLAVLDQELRAIFGNDIFGPARLSTYLSQHGHYPTVPELAGKVIPIAISAPSFVGGTDLVFHDGPCPPPGRSINLVANIATECDGVDRIPSLIPTSHVIRLDNHQADVSFKFGVPPNPVVVDRSAPLQRHIQGCDEEDIDVHEQGSFLFPYSKVSDAVRRALGIVPPDGIGVNPPEQDPRRTGFGWTLLIRPGLYQETLRIGIPLTLKKDDRFIGDGPVVIGKLVGFPI